MTHSTQDQADAIAIQSEATYHQANQFWILTNSELVNVCNAAIQHYIDTCINQLTGIAGTVPAQPEPVELTDADIDKALAAWFSKENESSGFEARMHAAIEQALKGGA